MISKKLFKKDKEALNELIAGAKTVYDMVSKTMGPYGKLVGYKNDTGMYSYSKDGVSIAKKIELSDEPKNMGSTALIQAANSQVKGSGDGTTLTTVLAYNFLIQGSQHIGSGINPTKLRESLQKFTQLLCDTLLDNADHITDASLRDIAIVSTNGNEEIGNLIYKAIKKVGEYGVVKHGESKEQKEAYIEYLDGYQWQQGVMFREFFNTASGLELDDPLVLVTDKRLHWGLDLEGIAKEVGTGTPLLIISPEVGNEALGAIIKNIQSFKFYTIKPEGMATTKKYMLEDIASLTGATFISEESGMQWKDIKLEHLGRAKKVKATVETTTLISNIKPTARIESLKEVLKTLKRSDHEKILIEKSLARLNGGVAIIRTHSDSEMEHSEVGDRIEDAVLACRSAQEEGITDGGGVALIKAWSEFVFSWPVFLSKEDRLALKILKNTIEAPIKQILGNADLSREADSIIKGLYAQKYRGYLIEEAKGVSSSMVELGIVDPVKVIRTALLNAVSVANMLLQTEGLIYEVNDGKK